MNTAHNLLILLGGAERDRTVGLLNAIQALSQLSYSPTRHINDSQQLNIDQEKLSIHFGSLSLKLVLGPYRRNI